MKKLFQTALTLKPNDVMLIKTRTIDTDSNILMNSLRLKFPNKISVIGRKFDNKSIKNTTFENNREGFRGLARLISNEFGSKAIIPIIHNCDYSGAFTVHMLDGENKWFMTPYGSLNPFAFLSLSKSSLSSYQWTQYQVGASEDESNYLANEISKIKPLASIRVKEHKYCSF